MLNLFGMVKKISDTSYFSLKIFCWAPRKQFSQHESKSFRLKSKILMKFQNFWRNFFPFKIFLWTLRNQFWEHQFLSKIVFTELRASLLAPYLRVTLFFWSFQQFHFCVIFHPQSTENIASLLRLLLYFLVRIWRMILGTITKTWGSSWTCSWVILEPRKFDNGLQWNDIASYM